MSGGTARGDRRPAAGGWRLAAKIFGARPGTGVVLVCGSRRGWFSGYETAPENHPRAQGPELETRYRLPATTVLTCVPFSVPPM
jgi:hypothetical protein